MEMEEAYQILGATKRDTPVSIKRKFRRLMHKHHPDSTGNDDAYMTQKIIEAYGIIKEADKEEYLKDTGSWEADINPFAFCDRTIFVDYSFLDDSIPIREAATGKYLWDPFLEDFNMLARSLAIRAADLARGCQKLVDEAKLFHLLMQEFIEPISCARKIGEEANTKNGWQAYDFVGAVGILDIQSFRKIEKGGFSKQVYGRRNGHRLAIFDNNGDLLGNLSYDDDSLYYVVNPLVDLKNEGIITTMKMGNLHANHSGSNFIGKLDINIRVKMKDDIRGKPACYHEEIQRTLGNIS